MSKLLNIIFILILTISFINCQEIINISNGPIRGNSFDSHKEFLGIGFAQPPVDQLRWKSPLAPSPWSDVYDATYERLPCAQICNLPPELCTNTSTEDCLYLNVFTPNIDFSTIQEPLPVMFFIAGGRFEMGSGSGELYNGTKMVNSSNIVFVSINYRLGIFGMLQTDTISGNLAFEDQLLALKWVQQNIKAFGGDPNQVTVFGESAGGTSCALHLTSPASAGLFSKIIIESNPWSLPIKTIDEAKDLAKIFAKDLGCDINDNACLYSKNQEELLLAMNISQNHFNVLAPLLTFLPWTPVVDGVLITDQPLALIQKGDYNKVPIIVGTVRNEALVFVAGIALDISKIEYIGGLIDIFGLSHEIKIYELYKPFINGSNFMDTLGVVGTDYIFVCPVRNAAMYLSTNSDFPVYTYQFQHVSSFNPYGNGYDYCADQVCHGLELPYVFGNAGQYTFSAQEQILSTNMQNYWTNFAVNGNPNIGNPVNIQWTQYSKSSDDMLTLDTPSYMQSNYLKNYCDYWDSLGYQVGW
ncbi:hypothetical protein DDB_G0291344 [Dictyostelium discoideum AX4]|uniref:Carboxylic ester hydrolase n=1 Tax=Dictyostelium discoideum TaxID=44689 RepID=Q54ET7_DICDI|nr:hypothetical protein DDB_G0291344 [Dictyostelium discoideum AX4]EAL61656.1 hypothetical protein DDB_G0291344 [Dictyostelium discoideum AX4]|eukprot:XP_635153.1 hypothetical protein DDB_G0291344 [Dictyostelium discoideum AX4]